MWSELRENRISAKFLVCKPKEKREREREREKGEQRKSVWRQAEYQLNTVLYTKEKTCWKTKEEWNEAQTEYQLNTGYRLYQEEEEILENKKRIECR